MTFILIPGRVALREKALGDGAVQHTMAHDASTLSMNSADMATLGVAAGDIVRVRSSAGVIDLPCQSGDLPPGLLWVAHGDLTSQLLDDDTEASGMPTTKGIDVTIERIGP